MFSILARLYLSILYIFLYTSWKYIEMSTEQSFVVTLHVKLRKLGRLQLSFVIRFKYLHMIWNQTDFYENTAKEWYNILKLRQNILLFHSCQISSSLMLQERCIKHIETHDLLLTILQLHGPTQALINGID